VFFTMVIDSFDGGKHGEGHGCRADADQVADFIKLQRGLVHPNLDELIDGICERAPEGLSTVKANAGKTTEEQCQICGYFGHEGKQCPDLKGVKLPAHRIGDRPHDRLSRNQHHDECDYCGGRHRGGAEWCHDKKNGRPPGRKKQQCKRCSGYGHDEKVCPTKDDVPTGSALPVPSRKADVKDIPVAATALNGGTNSVSGGGVFTFEDMMRVAAYMARVKDGDAPEDAVPALKIHGRSYGQ